MQPTPQPQPDTITAISIATLQVSTQHLTTLVEKIHETLEGTAKTPGMKEKLTIAQYNIELNKQAYHDVMAEVQRTEERLGKSMMEMSLNISAKIDEKFAVLKTDNEKQNTALQKIQPWINGIAWFVTVAGGVILSLLLSGKLHMMP